jgi:hypothetical protein
VRTRLAVDEPSRPQLRGYAPEAATRNSDVNTKEALTHTCDFDVDTPTEADLGEAYGLKHLSVRPPSEAAA